MAALELDYLSRPLPAWRPRGWYYRIAGVLLRSVGRLSRGIRIGLVHGFDSGVMLDYVYANRAQGDGWVGRIIDRTFLNAPGWSGIRNRGALIQKKIEAAISAAAVPNRQVRLADLACGGGSYVLAAIAGLPDCDVAATLRDYRAENVAKAYVNALHLGRSVKVEQADAFSDGDLARLGEVDVVVVSGLHEIVTDDAAVRNHFRQIVRLLPPGGVLILTIQPDHPQAEFIARVLTSHTGHPWAMRFRPVGLTRAWLEAAGFAVEDIEMERLGIFGVITARKA